MRPAMSVKSHAELFEAEQSEFPAKVPEPQLAVVIVVLTLELHTPDSHPDPGVKLLELPLTCGKRRCEVSRRAADDRVEFLDRV
jgi:hypothetical protein